MKWYLRRDGGVVYFGLHPAPDITGTDTWAILVPYVIVPADMSADADEPFTVSSNARKDLRFWHRALVHYAAYDLEKFRKDVARGSAQLQLFEAELEKYYAAMKPKQGSKVRLARDYRNVTNRPARWNPRA